MAVVALGADHAGFPLKEAVKTWLLGRGHEVRDFGTHSSDSVDYPDYAAAVACAVRDGAASQGVLVCGTGIGMAIAANKVVGVRAAPCADPGSARMARLHNDANVLALGARTTAEDVALTIVATWLETTFEGGRHVRRLEKVSGLERGRAIPPLAVEKSHAPAR